MKLDATQSPEVASVLLAVPEFEPVFQQALRDEGGIMGPFQAISTLAEWVSQCLADGSDDAPRRALLVIEEFITDRRFRLGSDLATEFIEAAEQFPEVEKLMGPRTLERTHDRRAQLAEIAACRKSN